MKKFNRFVSFILAFICVLSVVSLDVPEVHAASGTLVTDAVITERINELNDLLGKTYFNTGHVRADCGTKCKGHGCTSCANGNVVKQKWFKDLFGFSASLDPAKQFPKTYVDNTYLYPNARSCAGFASFAEWYIFRTGDKASVTTKKIGSYKSTKENWAKCQPGDLIRWNGHSFIYISSDSEKVKVLDCNWSGTDANGKTANNCMVQIHKIKMNYSSLKFTVSREKTRTDCKHEKGYQTEWAPDGSYRATVCKNCGASFKCKFDTSYAGAATVSKKTDVRTKAYGDSASLTSLAVGKSVKLISKTVNAYGNDWYKVTVMISGKEETGYIFGGHLTNFVCTK